MKLYSRRQMLAICAALTLSALAMGGFVSFAFLRPAATAPTVPAVKSDRKSVV